jgi:hypothetical protein
MNLRIIGIKTLKIKTTFGHCTNNNKKNLDYCKQITFWSLFFSLKKVVFFLLVLGFGGTNVQLLRYSIVQVSAARLRILFRLPLTTTEMMENEEEGKEN